MRWILIISITILFSVSTSARPGGHGRGRGRQRGRQMEAVEAAEAPATVDNEAIIDEALSTATDVKDAVEVAAEVSAPDALAAGETLQASIDEAIAAAKEQPQAELFQADIVAAQVKDSHALLDEHLKAALEIQTTLTKYGSDMEADDVVNAHVALHQQLELALHYAVQNDAAIQQDKAIEVGAPPAEAAEVAAEVKLQGRSMSIG